MALVEKAFGDIITFTRASGGGRINSLGQYEWVAANEPRLTHDPITLQPLGLLVEEQRTNLLAYSSDFTSAPWSKGTGVTITPASSQAPDGSISATLVGGLQSNAGDRLFQIVTQATPVTTAGSVWLKGTPASVGQTVIFEVRRNAGTSANTQMTVTLTAQWQRVSIALTMLPDNTGLRLIFSRGTANEAYVWGAQLEVGAFATSYIPTEASQVTRAADVPNVNTLAPWYNASEGTLVVSGIPNDGSGVVRAIAGFDDGTAANRLQLRHTGSTTRCNALAIAGSAQSCDFLSGPNTWPIGAMGKAALSYQSNAFAFSCNGAAPQFDTAGAVPVVSRMSIGAGPNSQSFNGIIEDITYYPRVIDVQQASA